jgi:HK97 family phage major capsid protein
LQTIEQRMARKPGPGGEPETKSWGAVVSESPELADLIRKGKGSARVRIETKATILTSGAGGLVPPDARVEPVLLPRRRLTVRDLLTQGRTSSNAVRFVRLTSRSLNAAPVSESTAKPEATLALLAGTPSASRHRR